MTETQIRARVQRMVAKTQAVAVARDLKITPQYLHDFLKGQRKPGKKLLAALKLEKVVSYRAVRR